MDRIDCGLIELKAEGDPQEMIFSGYGAVFGNVDSYGDVIAKGAFTQTIKEAKDSGIWPAMLLQHGGWGMSAEDVTPIGVWTEMKEDNRGLFLEGKLAPTKRGQEMYALLKMQPRPAISGLSIGYRPVKWKSGDGAKEPRRTLEEVKLMEISPVTFPANGKARVRSVKAGDLSEREFERMLMQDAGFSRSEARIIINEGFKSLSITQDADGGGLQEIVQALKSRAHVVPR